MPNAKRRPGRAGFDVHVGRVAAYSTLGWFDDPLLSTFIGYPDARLAELLFHELAHGVLFVPGDSAFNVGFATFVGREGAVQWLRATGRDPAPHLAAERAAAHRAAFFRAWRERLRALYAEPLAPDQRRLLKGALFEAMDACYAEFGIRGRPGFGGTLGRVNNARLAAMGTYEDRTAAFAALLARVGAIGGVPPGGPRDRHAAARGPGPGLGRPTSRAAARRPGRNTLPASPCTRVHGKYTMMVDPPPLGRIAFAPWPFSAYERSSIRSTTHY